MAHQQGMQTELCTPLCVQVPVYLSPSAAAGCARAYPSGAPVLVPLRRSPCAPGCRTEADYLIRQPFIAEFPVSLRAGVCVKPPRMLFQKAPARARKAAPASKRSGNHVSDRSDASLPTDD